MRTCPGSSSSPRIIKQVLGMVPIQKKRRSKRGYKDKVLDMALGSAPKSAGKKPSNRKKSNSQKPPVTETRDLLEGNRSVFVNPQAPVFPLNVAPVPILLAMQQQTENNRLNSLFPEAAPHQPVIQNVFPFAHSPFPHSPIPRSPVPPFPGFKDSRFQSISRFSTEKTIFLPVFNLQTLKTSLLLVFYSYSTCMYSYVLVFYSYVTRMYSCVTHMYSYVTRMLLVCTRVLLVCTRMYLCVTRMLLVCTCVVPF